MVFSSLQPHEKDAFFSLLDEYFASRPEVFSGGNAAQNSSESQSTPERAAASLAHKALASNPEATQKILSAGLRQSIPKSSPYAAAAHNPAMNNFLSKAATASVVASAPGDSGSKSQPPPPPAPRRSVPGSTEPPSITSQSSGTTRKFGDIDLSSAKNMYTSLRNSTANKSKAPSPPPVVNAVAVKKNEFGPPPVRRVPLHEPEPEPEVLQELEAQGVWAEALYDFAGEDPADLNIKTGEHVFVTERSSADWWTGMMPDGKTGLFPASYVKLL